MIVFSSLLCHWSVFTLVMTFCTTGPLAYVVHSSIQQVAICTALVCKSNSEEGSRRATCSHSLHFTASLHQRRTHPREMESSLLLELLVFNFDIWPTFPTSTSTVCSHVLV